MEGYTDVDNDALRVRHLSFAGTISLFFFFFWLSEKDLENIFSTCDLRIHSANFKKIIVVTRRNSSSCLREKSLKGKGRGNINVHEFFGI